ncbi:MAG: acid phosphatase [Janthinobacterium lividum]
MTDTSPPASPPPDDTETVPGRRRFLAGLAAATAGSALGAPASNVHAAEKASAQPPPSPPTDRQLRESVRNVVVIYAENRSFNNLFADFPGLAAPLSAFNPAHFPQLDRDGKTALRYLPPVPGGWVLRDQVADGLEYRKGEQYQIRQPNAPFALKGPRGEALPLSIVTHDLWHVFYQNQMQINGGRNDMFVAWADSGGFTMGHYGNASYSLQLWNIAAEFVLCDNFFQGAFGGSFLNHQYLIAATPPRYPRAEDSIAKGLIANTVSGDPRDPRLKPLSTSPASAMDGIPRFGPSALTPAEALADGTTRSYAVNTMLPPFQPTPSAKLDARGWVDLSLPENASFLPPQTHDHIGDKLDRKNVQWAWYAGAFQQTLDMQGRNTSDGTPVIPNFQYHHQPLNYFANLGPGTAARAHHLRDGGLGDEIDTNRFMADAQAGVLPPVAFYKPQGNLNMHAGYADVASGDRHIAHVVRVLRASPQWRQMVIVIAVDENGGWWDHVAPPKADRWGPGTRIPALIVSPFARRGLVDHTVYDTGSILRLITRVFDLDMLEGLALRDEAMVAQGHAPMGDLTAALDLT